MAFHNISNHPTYGFKRAVDLDKTEIWISLKSQVVELLLKVVHFLPEAEISDGNQIAIVPPIVVSLKATNNTFVDPATGIPYPTGTEVPPDAVPEFIFFRAAMGQPAVIDDMITGKIQWADAVGRFDV